MGLFRRILAFILGIFFGIFSIIVGIIVVLSTVKIKDILSIADGEGEIVSDELGNNTVLQLFLKIVGGEGVILDMNTLEDVNKNFPILERKFNAIVDKNSKYTALLGISSFDDVKNWRLDSIPDSAVAMAKEHVSLTTVANAIDYDLHTLGIPMLYEESYIKLSSANASETSGQSKYNSAASGEIDITETLAELDSEGICYKNGENFLPAYKNGKLIAEAKGKELYYNQLRLVNLGMERLMPVVNTLLKDGAGKLNLGLFTLDWLKDSIGIDLLASVDLLNEFLSPDDALEIVNDVNVIYDRILGKKPSELFSTQALSSIGDTITNNDVLQKILKYGDDDEEILKSIVSGTKDETGEDGKTEESYLVSNLMSLTFSELGVNLESEFFDKLTHDGENNELSVRETIEGIGERKLNEIIAADTGFLQNFLGLSFDEIQDSAKHVWDENGELVLDENGEPTVDDANGETYVDHAINSIKLGEVFEVEETTENAILLAIKDETLGDLTNEENFTNIINDIKIGDIIGENESTSEIIKTLGELKIGELKDGDKVKGKIDSLALCDILDVGDNKLLISLCYFDGDTENTAPENKVTISGISDRINELKLSDIMDCSGNNILEYLSDAKIMDLDGRDDSISDKISVMTIKNVIGEPSADSSPLFTNDNFINTKITELATINFSTYKLREVINVPESGILKELENCEIGNLQEGINKLEIGTIVPDFGDNSILSSLQHSTVETLATDLNNLKVQSAFNIENFTLKGTEAPDTTKMYFNRNENPETGKITYTQITDEAQITDNSYVLNPNIWLIILYNSEYNPETNEYTYTEQEVTIKNIGDRITTVGESIGELTLRELKLIGLISTYPSGLAEKSLNEFMLMMETAVIPTP